jgi:fructosamine-3-kinase
MTMLHYEVETWLAEQGAGEVVNQQRVGGGSINDCQRLHTRDGRSYFFKHNLEAKPDMFQREAEGLQALRVSGGPRVPEVYLVGQDFLLLEDLNPNGRKPDFWACFGRQVAAVHNKTRKTFGFAHDNYLGTTPQPNPQTADGYSFFGEQRLCYLGLKACEAGLISRTEMDRIADICRRLRDLVPEQPASLLHGDLWSGNALHDHIGNPALIDPAAHYGWAEAELGMTTLFGGFPSEFYGAYNEVRRLEPGWEKRLPLYNLYHLLNHLLLFGRGYYGQVMQVVQQFS